MPSRTSAAGTPWPLASATSASTTASTTNDATPAAMPWVSGVSARSRAATQPAATQPAITNASDTFVRVELSWTTSRMATTATAPTATPTIAPDATDRRSSSGITGASRLVRSRPRDLAEGIGKAELAGVEDAPRAERLLHIGKHGECRSQRSGHEARPVQAHTVVVAEGAALGEDGLGRR